MTSCSPSRNADKETRICKRLRDVLANEQSVHAPTTIVRRMSRADNNNVREASQWYERCVRGERCVAPAVYGS